MFKFRYAVVCKECTYHGLDQKEVNVVKTLLEGEGIKHNTYIGIYRVVHKNGKKKFRTIQHSKFPYF